MPGLSGTPITAIRAFHGLVFFKSNQGARGHFGFERDQRIGQARQDTRLYLIFAGEFHRADLQHLRTQAGHLQHFFERHAVKPARFFDHARVGRVDTVDVRIDQALVRFQRSRDGHRRGVRTAATERRDMAFRVDALEAGDHHHLARVEIAQHALAVDFANACLGERAVGFDRHLPTGVADRIDACFLQRDGEQSRTDLLAGGGNHVEFAWARLGRNVFREAEQAVRFAGHRRGHDDHLVTGLVPFRDALRDVLDALDRAHRSTAVFMYDECHCRSELEK
jgi:hypothetical protein